jgi:hypothetical protein
LYWQPVGCEPLKYGNLKVWGFEKVAFCFSAKATISLIPVLFYAAPLSGSGAA